MKETHTVFGLEENVENPLVFNMLSLNDMPKIIFNVKHNFNADLITNIGYQCLKVNLFTYILKLLNLYTLFISVNYCGRQRYVPFGLSS